MTPQEAIAKAQREGLAKLPLVRRMTYWWYSLVGRFAVHLPWMLCVLAMWAFMGTEQGSTAFEYPVSQPLLGVALVGVLTGMCWTYTAGVALFHRLYAFQMLDYPLTLARVPSSETLPLGRRLWVAPEVVKPKFATTSTIAAFIALWLFAGTGVCTVASLSYSGPLVTTVFVASVLVGAVICRLAVASRSEWVGLLLLGCAPLLIYVALTALVGQHPEAVSSIGPHALIAAGSLLLTLLFLSIKLVLQALRAPRIGWLLLALLVVAHLLQSPLSERPNPLLSQVPQMERADSECARASAPVEQAATSSGTSLQTAVSPSLLVSAEGGGIRAAYWTAVSLEYLAQTSAFPAVSSNSVFSGVSGGSLGIATFMAAQELPKAARLPCIQEFLAGDFLSPLVAGLFFLDVPRLILPTWMVDTHRGDVFEAYVARRWLRLTGRDYFYRPLKHAGGTGPHQAAVYFNTTDAVSGQLIALPTLSKAPHAQLPLPELTPLNAAVLSQLGELRIAQAVHMSARFPYLSPNLDIRVPAKEASEVLFGQTESAGSKPRDVTLASLVDGGYFDNSALFATQRLLRADVAGSQALEWTVIHILNDQARTCKQSPNNSGCVRVGELSLEARKADGRGWLVRPLDAIFAVRAEHSLLSVSDMQAELTRARKKPPVVWAVPMPSREALPSEGLETLIDLVQKLPIHGRDIRYGGVALGWTLAPKDRRFLCESAAALANVVVPGVPREEDHQKAPAC